MMKELISHELMVYLIAFLLALLVALFFHRKPWKQVLKGAIVTLLGFAAYSVIVGYILPNAMFSGSWQGLKTLATEFFGDSVTIGLVATAVYLVLVKVGKILKM